MFIKCGTTRFVITSYKESLSASIDVEVLRAPRAHRLLRVIYQETHLRDCALAELDAGEVACWDPTGYGAQVFWL